MAKAKDTFYFNLSTTENIGIGLFKYRLIPTEHFIIINRAVAEINGYQRKRDVFNKDFASFFVSHGDYDNFLSTLQKQHKVRFFETRFKKKGHNRVWVAITAAYIKTDHQEFIEGVIEDITAHHKMQDKLSLERDYMQNLLDSIPDAIYFKDRKNRIIKVNKFYAQGVGLDSSRIIGKTDFDFFPRKQAKKMFQDDNFVLATGKSIIGKVERTILPNGTCNQVITTKIPMFDRKGKIIGTMGVTRDMTAYANLEHDRMGMVRSGFGVLLKALELRDPYTFSHTQGVADIVERIGKELGWDDNHLLGARLAAELHDLGKMSVPMDILNKSGKLTDLERQFIYQHVASGYNLIKDVDFSFPVADIIYQHHERLDGSGYPQHLTADKIRWDARVLAASDVLEAVTSHRSYRPALGLDKAQQELREGAGSKYDRKVIGVIIKLIAKNHHQPFWRYG